MLDIGEEETAAAADLAAAPALQGFRQGKASAGPPLAMGGIFGGEDDDLEGPVAMEFGTTSLLDTFASSLFKDVPAAGDAPAAGARGEGDDGEAKPDSSAAAAAAEAPAEAPADTAGTKKNPFAKANAAASSPAVTATATTATATTATATPSPNNPFATAKAARKAAGGKPTAAAPKNPFQ